MIVGESGQLRIGRKTYASYDSYKASKARQRKANRHKRAAVPELREMDAQRRAELAADRHESAAQAAFDRQLNAILDCDALWAVNPRADDALEQLDRVPERIRRLCLLLLPPDMDPVYLTIRIRQAKDPKPYTLDMLGRPYGVTRERARQIQESALAVARGCKRLQQMHAELEAHRPTAWEELEWS